MQGERQLQAAHPPAPDPATLRRTYQKFDPACLKLAHRRIGAIVVQMDHRIPKANKKLIEKLDVP